VFKEGASHLEWDGLQRHSFLAWRRLSEHVPDIALEKGELVAVFLAKKPLHIVTARGSVCVRDRMLNKPRHFCLATHLGSLGVAEVGEDECAKRRGAGEALKCRAHEALARVRSGHRFHAFDEDARSKTTRSISSRASVRHRGWILTVLPRLVSPLVGRLKSGLFLSTCAHNGYPERQATAANTKQRASSPGAHEG